MNMTDLSALMGEELTAESNAGVWVVVPGDSVEGRASAGDLALVAEARRLADGLGCYVHAVVASEAYAQEAIAYGADRVHVTGQAAAYLAGQHPEFVLLPASENGQAAALAQRLRAGLVTGVRGGVQVEPDTRALLASHPVYGGDYFVDMAVTSAVKMATVETGALPAPYPDRARSGEVIQGDPAPLESRLRDLGPADYQPPAWRPLAKARVIVAAGRGVHDAEGFALAANLARVLGAELAGDRSAKDSGWIDEAHEVGVTGQEVAPELYVAVGVLGDTVHNAAITGARQVIAIHPNPQAPIFAVADIAVAGEPKTILPQMIAALR
jgi:electron transfer flavoprotein alpha subunit